VHEIGAAGADVRTEHIRAVAFVVHAARDGAAGIGQRLDVADEEVVQRLLFAAAGMGGEVA
jgi:hypothetical protein